MVGSYISNIWVCDWENNNCVKTDSQGFFQIKIPSNERRLNLALETSYGDWLKLGTFEVPNTDKPFFVSPLSVIPSDEKKAAIFRTLLHALGGDSYLNATRLDLGKTEITGISCGGGSCPDTTVAELIKNGYSFTVSGDYEGSPLKVSYNSDNQTVELCLNGTCKSLKTSLYDWLVLIYMNGDNNLNDFAKEDLKEIQNAKIPPFVKVVVLADFLGNDGGYLYETDGEDGVLKAVTNIPEPDMGDPQTLRDFLTTFTERYPAEKRVLIVWNHGTGWKALPADSAVKVASYDKTSGDYLYMYEFAQALADVTANGANPFDLIGFDECLMGNLEVFYDIADYTRYIVASEHFEPAIGWNYTEVFQRFLNNWEKQNDATAFGKAVVDAYRLYSSESYPLTMVLISSSQVEALVEGLNQMVERYLANADTYTPAVENVRNSLPTIGGNDYGLVDLYNLALNLNGTFGGVGTETIVNTIRSLYRYTSDSNFQGISIYFPSDRTYFDTSYFCSQSQPCGSYYNPFTSTLWDEFLKTYFGF